MAETIKKVCPPMNAFRAATIKAPKNRKAPASFAALHMKKLLKLKYLTSKAVVYTSKMCKQQPLTLNL
jgi:hypothetical protein